VGNWTYNPVSTLPAPLDVVWCRFPVDLDLGNPGPKQRPGLVAKTALDADGCPTVLVVYGTSNLKHATRKFDMFVENFRDMHEAGLYQATRFDMDRHLWLPWAEEFFQPPSAQYANPAIGHLSENSQELLRIVLDLRRKELWPNLGDAVKDQAATVLA
jgi:hypothetical protein